MNKTFLTNKNLLSEVQQWVKANLAGQIDYDRLLTLIIVVNEVIQNIYRYAYKGEDSKSIDVNLVKAKRSFEFIIFDNGIPCQDQSFISKDNITSEDGGFGMKIILENTETFEIIPNKNGNLTLVRFKK